MKTQTKLHRTLQALLIIGVSISALAMANATQAQAAKELKTYAQTTELPAGLRTPDVVETSIGTLNFIDGAPLPETAKLVYENLDRMRGVDAFL